MKSMLMFFSLSIACVLGAWASGSGTEGHGGDSYCAEFSIIGEQLVTDITFLPESRRYGMNPTELQSTIQNTLCESTDEPLVLDGSRVVDAINYPDRHLLEINRGRWGSSDPQHKAMLVLHEYLSLAGKDDSNYVISASVMMALSGTVFFPNPSQTGSPNPWPSDWPTPSPLPLPSISPSPFPSDLPGPFPSPDPSGFPIPVPSPSGLPFPIPSPSL